MENLESVCVWIINTHLKWLSQLQRLNEKGSTVWNICIYMPVCVCVFVYTHIYNWHIINFADNLHHWFGGSLCQWQLPESQFHKTVHIPDHVFTVQLVRFFVIFTNTSHPDISSSDRLFSQVCCAAHTKNHSHISSYISSLCTQFKMKDFLLKMYNTDLTKLVWKTQMQQQVCDKTKGHN